MNLKMIKQSAETSSTLRAEWQAEGLQSDTIEKLAVITRIHQIDYELITKVARLICSTLSSAKDEAILVFLPGVNEYVHSGLAYKTH